MPNYWYKCEPCSIDKVEIFRSLSEDEPNNGYPCEKCGNRLQRIYSAASVHFKGSGFYSTDK